ncbi:acetyl-CoA synthetase-like protein [Gonapodya prolifera JEL478]|uniref:Acetyl-CoA synthetase-like protein n=1 Tax=Gonapodya prolifera (strain JEL478) TaxID=1344416 RepID=A0A139AUN7_GONPJ|nr:acetyl-CoA synthetase-like protein [Gonapodya prolifera JEL478]|eukprot:KXS20442.1 acetyl-CoA synthetase-like protein [Gonapodya prolifera JEL478]
MTIFKSSFPDVTIPDIDIFSFLFPKKLPSHRVGRTAYVDSLTGKTISHDALKGLCEDLAAALVGRFGVKEGSVVGIFSPNDLAYPLAFLAPLRVGGITTTNNVSNNTEEELVHQLTDSSASVLFTHPNVFALAVRAGKTAGINKDKLILFSRDDKDPEQKAIPTVWELLAEWGAKRKQGKAPLPAFRLGAEAKKRVAILAYSSGTTGRSKGVMISHTNVVANITQLELFDREETKANPTPSCTAVLPMYHIYGIVYFLHYNIFRGCLTVIFQKFEPVVFLEACQKYKCSILYLVPPLVLFLAQSPLVDKYDLTAVRCIYSAAAPLPWESVVQLQKRKTLKNWHLVQGWGMTESCVAVTNSPMPGNRESSVGIILPSQEVKLVDPDTGRVVGVGEEGELLVRGPNITLGYLNNAKATAETYDADGFLHTGDIGVFEPDGHLQIKDRIKELIKVKGLQVAPAELEAVLLGHPAVADSCVVQVPDERSGELPRAYVVLHANVDSSNGTRDSIYKHVSKHLARHKWLDGGIKFVESVPKSPSGKILRRYLRDQAKKEWAAEKSAKL